MFPSRAKRPILGVDISISGVKLVELAQSGESYRVEAYASEPIPADSMDDADIVDVEAVAQALDDPRVVVIDVRDQNELAQTGTVPGARHASRGMLEFYADPASPKHLPVFAEAESLILYCGTSGRSALAANTLKQMGFENVTHMTGGFKAWVEAGYPVDPFTAETSS